MKKVCILLGLIIKEVVINVTGGFPLCLSYILHVLVILYSVFMALQCRNL